MKHKRVLPDLYNLLFQASPPERRRANRLVLTWLDMKGLHILHLVDEYLVDVQPNLTHGDKKTREIAALHLVQGCELEPW